MADVVIDNPILNSPFREPSRHFKFDDAGITDEVEEKRRRTTSPAPARVAATHSASAALRPVISEVYCARRSGEPAKVEPAPSLPVPAVNSHAGLCRWTFVKTQGPWHCVEEVQEAVKSLHVSQNPDPGQICLANL